MSKKQQRSQHDGHVYNLERTVRGLYLATMVGVEYRFQSRVIGEIDLLGYPLGKRNHWGVYEVKCNYGEYNHAVDQLLRIKEHVFPTFNNVNYFVYIGHDKHLERLLL